MFISVTALVLSAAPMNDRAVVKHTSREYQQCAPRVETEMEQLSCILPELQRQDALLRKATEDTMRRLPRRKQAAFGKLQRQWGRHRSEKCERDSRHAPSTVIAKTQCMLFETVRRAEWLEQYR